MTNRIKIKNNQKNVRVRIRLTREMTLEEKKEFISERIKFYMDSILLDLVENNWTLIQHPLAKQYQKLKTDMIECKTDRDLSASIGANLLIYFDDFVQCSIEAEDDDCFEYVNFMCRVIAYIEVKIANNIIF